MKIQTEFYERQKAAWPKEGRHILAHYDEESVVVYQAYKPYIGQFAAQNGYFGGEFSLSRMSWFKPNFLWMMYRSGWGTKENQEVTLAVRVRRPFFDFVLGEAVASSFGGSDFGSEEEWKRAVASSDVRLQWDPDHSPSGAPLPRRALQIGLRGNALKEYAEGAVVEIEDISAFVAEMRPFAAPGRHAELRTPTERVYTPAQAETAARLQLSLLG